jgi:hypothetical protein
MIAHQVVLGCVSLLEAAYSYQQDVDYNEATGQDGWRVEHSLRHVTDRRAALMDALQKVQRRRDDAEKRLGVIRSRIDVVSQLRSR